MTSGKKKRGRKPRVVESTAVEAKANITDPASRVIKTRQDQIILAVGVTQEANDVQQLKPMLETLERTLQAAGI